MDTQTVILMMIGCVVILIVAIFALKALTNRHNNRSDPQNNNFNEQNKFTEKNSIYSNNGYESREQTNYYGKNNEINKFKEVNNKNIKDNTDLINENINSRKELLKKYYSDCLDGDTVTNKIRSFCINNKLISVRYSFKTYGEEDSEYNDYLIYEAVGENDNGEYVKETFEIDITDDEREDLDNEISVKAGENYLNEFAFVDEDNNLQENLDAFAYADYSGDVSLTGIYDEYYVNREYVDKIKNNQDLLDMIVDEEQPFNTDFFLEDIDD